jgi:hypothetical protein
MSELQMTPLVVTVIIGTVLPLLTGLLTKLQASDTVKGVVNLTLAAASGVITAGLVADGGALISREALIYAVLAWVQSVATYLGIWKSLDINARLIPTKGLG